MSTTTPIPQRPPIKPVYPRSVRINPWLIRLPILAISGTILLLVVLALFLTAYQLRHADKIFPGVSAMGIPLGGMTRDEALLALAGSNRYDTSAVFTFRDGNHLWQMTAADLGVAFDLEATVAEAFAVGHRDNPVSSLVEQGDAWLNGYAVAPIIRYDEAVALAKLNEIAAEVNRPTINAALTMEGKTVKTVDGQSGRTLDVWTTLFRLNDAVLQMQSGIEIPLVINETPPQVWNVDESATKIRNALSSPLTLTATDETGQPLGPWTASIDQLAALLVVERVNNGDGTQSYNVSLNTGAFEGYLASLAPGLVTSPQDGRFEFNDATGQLEVIQPAVSGRKLNIPETLKRMEHAIFTVDNRTVPMAFDYTLPRFHNQITAAELGITQIVAEATTYFTGSTPERRTNIALSASRLNGVIIAPGEEFSFNRLVGDIAPETGFVQGKVIFGGRTVEGVGGGVCQTSTTVFRAAFAGGYAITERNSHGYRVGFYELGGFPPGLDAAIWQPERDFRFQNNTPYHLLIETSFMPDTDALQIRFYSTKYFNAEIENAVIKNVTPALPTRYEVNQNLRQGELLQVDYSAEGAEVTVYRNVYDMQGNLVSEDYIYTNYLPWGAIYQVAPGDARLNQS